MRLPTNTGEPRKAVSEFLTISLGFGPGSITTVVSVIGANKQVFPGQRYTGESSALPKLEPFLVDHRAGLCINHTEIMSFPYNSIDQPFVID